MLQPALLAVIRSRRQEKYPNGLHQRTGKHNPAVACAVVSVQAQAPHPHTLKPSKCFMMRNLWSDLPLSPSPSVPSMHSRQVPGVYQELRHHWVVTESLCRDGWHTLPFQALLWVLGEEDLPLPVSTSAQMKS